MTAIKLALSARVPAVWVAVFEILSRAPVTLVVAEALFVIVVLERSSTLPVSVKVCDPVAFVLEEEMLAISPVNEAVADDEVRAAEKRPPEVIPWAADVREAVVAVVALARPVMLNWFVS